MSDQRRLLMLGAMYENGGNTVHRFLDGHPQLFVYPYESQLGTRLVNDALSSTFPVKYRWPAFALDATPREDYHAIIDEEAKVRARTPNVSKFRDLPFEMDDDQRRSRYVSIVEHTGRSRGQNVMAFFQATFDSWTNLHRSSRESMYVGYSPILAIDADKILNDLPSAHFLHVVRNPWSAYADTKKRPLPLSLSHYTLGWTLNQQHALLFQKQFPGRMHIVRLEDVLANPMVALGAICETLGLERASSLLSPSWNGVTLREVHPWGTIRQPTPDANRATAMELSGAERDEIAARTWPFLDVLDYTKFL